MNCTVTSIQGTDALTIEIQGTFNFSVQRPFRDAYARISETTKRIVVDMAQVDHVDSSALGMLVLMQKNAKARDVTVSLVNCDDHLRRLLRVGQLDTVFEVTGTETSGA
ncbi:MAG: STAS domain-containing protein [Gemmatimonadota bacterium]|nr:MAG: STAS domain-containing protein [Gemmatimonadota bacterium]